MSALPRRDPFLAEAIDILDIRLAEAKGNTKEAFESLNHTELDFVDGEIEKCLNFRYYAENYHIIGSEADGFKTLYPFWDSQEIFYHEIYKLQIAGKRVKVIVLKARQLGLSTISEALVFHKTIFKEACNTLVVAQDPGQADYLFGMSRTAYDSLPWWMRPERRYEAKGRYLVLDRSDPSERLMNPGLRSQIFVEAANKMTGVAVGKTLHAAHLSEMSSWNDPKILAEQIFPTMNAPDELAIMESTARGRKDFFHMFWNAAWKGKVDWTPIFIEFFRVRKYSTPIPTGFKFELTPEEKALRNKVDKDKKIIITNEQFYWRRKKIEEFMALQGDDSKFYQEYPSATWVEAFQGSGICAFNKKKLQYILDTTCCDPLWFGEITLEETAKGPTPRIKLTRYDKEKGDLLPVQEEYGARLRVWEQPVDGESYYLSADVAHGVKGGNFSCAQVIKIGRGKEPDEQVAEWHGWINPTPYSYILAALGYWYNTAEIAVECNDVGLSTNNHLSRVLEYPQLFRWKHYDKIKNFITDFLGWYTNSKTRDLIISKMREAMDEGSIILRSEELIDECLDFGSEDNERFEGQEGDDDRVLAIMMANHCAHDSEWGKAVASSPRNIVDPKELLKRDFANTDWSVEELGKQVRVRPPGEVEVPKEVEMYGQINPEEKWKML